MNNNPLADHLRSAGGLFMWSFYHVGQKNRGNVSVKIWMLVVKTIAFASKSLAFLNLSKK